MLLASVFLILTATIVVGNKRIDESTRIDDVIQSVVRVRRDGGLVTGAVAAAVTGVIGMTARAVSDYTTFHPHQSAGGCRWFGTSPFCNHECPADFDLIRESNGRCSNWWMAGFCVPDASFGKPCSTIFGNTFSKRFCCKSDPTDCTWSGRWMAAETAYNIYCRYNAKVGECGQLTCAINHYTYQGYNASVIVGEHCDQLAMWNRTARATCGYIAWFDVTSGELVDSWYKSM